MTKEERTTYNREWNRAHKSYYRNYYMSHREDAARRNRESIIRHPDKGRWDALKRKYGITKKEYEALFLEQDGRCAICGSVLSGQVKRGKPSPLFVDHNHTTGKVRGLLCHDCNLAIGWVEKLQGGGIEAFESYLHAHEVSLVGYLPLAFRSKSV